MVNCTPDGLSSVRLEEEYRAPQSRQNLRRQM